MGDEKTKNKKNYKRKIFVYIAIVVAAIVGNIIGRFFGLIGVIGIYAIGWVIYSYVRKKL